MGYRSRFSFGGLTYREMFAAMTKGERFFCWLALVNFGSFIIVSLVLGGDALNGTARDGHYYLDQKGTYTEVSRGVFVYSVIHALSLFVTHPLAIVTMFKARSRVRRSASGYRVYTSSHVHSFQFIRRSRDLGFSVAQIETFRRCKEQRRHRAGNA